MASRAGLGHPSAEGGAPQQNHERKAETESVSQARGEEIPALTQPHQGLDPESQHKASAMLWG